MTTAPLSLSRSRRLLKVRGVVQGVGFRPTVYRIAVEQGLAGFVRNEADGVTIEVEGDEPDVAAFADILRKRAPAAARIDAIEAVDLIPSNDRQFRVEVSAPAHAARRTQTPVDRATCDDCLTELFNPADRRYRYPFITCTNCGPRYTIVRDLPYDRPLTTMSSFRMCATCQAEYDDPLDRRFHAETNACGACGPNVSMPLTEATTRLRAGEILALKGIGGFHLATDAANEQSVSRLREKKHRLEKAFAVMVRDFETATRIAIIDEAGGIALRDSSRPIVCFRKRSDAPVAAAVAPGLREIGIMLPYSPLHHLLLADGPPVLVMTSGNAVDEPVAIENGDALLRLTGIADAFLSHDRPIHARADDSVIRIVSSGPQPIRRSRGFVPDPIRLPFDAPPVLAVGAELKVTTCLAYGESAYLSPHIGDLSHPLTLAFFEETISSMIEMHGVEPRAVAHDMHPDLRSTRWALRAEMPRVPVQHHHAHVASCLADNGRTDRVIGVAFDGTGCGPAGELWGGEFLVCDMSSFTRAGHIRAIALPGGEAAIREPWRLAAAALADAGEPLDVLQRIDASTRRRIAHLVEKRLRAPLATSAGRWFDAVASLCGIRDVVTYEGQAAMELEAIAESDCEPYPFDLTSEIDLRATIRAIAGDVRAGTPRSLIAGRFHETLAVAIGASCERIRTTEHVNTVALSGGCFQNRLLTERTGRILEERGFEVLLHRRVPPNDGGIALGQAAVAAFRMRGAAR